MREENKTHPSYGRIVLSKTSCGLPGATLFGSRVKHGSFIRMDIQKASVSEDGFSEFIHGRGSIVSLYMTNAQWAQMVSSFGQGEGTPVTLRWTKTEGDIELPPDEVPVIDLAKKTADEVKRDLVKLFKGLEADVNRLSSKQGTVSKRDLAGLAKSFSIIASHIDSNLDFLEERVVNRMEKEVARAQVEIEALITNTMARLGERALGQRLAAGEIVQDLLTEG